MGRLIARLFVIPFIALGALLIVDMQILAYRTIEEFVLSKFIRDDGCAAQANRGQYNRSCHFIDLIDPLSPILVLTRHQSLEVSQHLYPMVVQHDRVKISVSRIFGAIGHVSIVRNGTAAGEFHNAAPRTLTIIGCLLLLPSLLFFVKARPRPAVVEPRTLTLEELEAFRVPEPGRIRSKSLRYSPSGDRTSLLHRIRRGRRRGAGR